MSARKFGASWWADFTCQRKRYRIKSPDNSHAGAKNFENLARQRLARGEPITGLPEPVSITFADFAKDWMERYVKVNNKPSEQRTKEYVLRCHLLPWFGAVALDCISTSRIEDYKAAKLAAGLHPKTVNNHLVILQRCLRSALEWEQLRALPRAKPLRVEPKEIGFLLDAECERLLAAARASGGMPHAMIQAALHTGMRLGELLALEWKSVDETRGQITVSRSLVRGNVSSPKSNRIRHIPMTSDLLATLRSRRRPQGVVFARPDGTALTDMMASTILRKACQQAGLQPVGWHRLRHTFASQLVCRGVSLRAVQKLLGHSTVMMTERYAHLAPTVLDDAIRVLEKHLVSNLWATGGQRATTESLDGSPSAHESVRS